jgi:penicillin-binding protein 2
VGMAPRRNPDIVVAVLWENGNWGANSAKLAAQVIDAYVNKQRRRDNNLRIAEIPKPAPAPAAPVEAPVAAATIPRTPAAE